VVDRLFVIILDDLELLLDLAGQQGQGCILLGLGQQQVQILR